MNLTGSETQKNLARAFAGESQARNRYDFTAEQLKREGKEYLYTLINEISRNEHAHAKIFWDFLTQDGGFANIDFDAGYPFTAGDSIKNLEEAAHGEMQEASEIYPHFAEVAKKEGFNEVAAAFTQIAKIESGHNTMFIKMKDGLQNDTLYKKENSTTWRCTNCGFEFDGKEVAAQCPVCKKPTGYFNTPIKKCE